MGYICPGKSRLSYSPVMTTDAFSIISCKNLGVRIDRKFLRFKFLNADINDWTG
jgi:hypothetical protein